MRELPSWSMRDWEVLAIRDDQKTQVRLVMKPQPHCFSEGRPIVYTRPGVPGKDYSRPIVCPYSPGDRLWVREAWQPTGVGQSLGTQIHYRADGQARWVAGHSLSMPPQRWRRAAVMPRWASRSMLEVISTRPEELQKISEADIRAEGVYSVCTPGSAPVRTQTVWVAPGVLMTDMSGEHSRYAPAHISARYAFESLWDDNNKKHPWSNRWVVWVIEFRKVVA